MVDHLSAQAADDRRRLVPRWARIATAAVILPAAIVPTLALSAGAAWASVAFPTCTLGQIGIQNDGDTSQPGTMQLIAQDTTSGLKKLTSPFHMNATKVLGAFTTGSKAPVVNTFTQVNESTGSSGSLRIVNVSGQKTICLGQFKGITARARAYATGYAFPSDRNNLVIQNSSTTPLTSVYIQINGSCQLNVSLTAGQLYSIDMTNIGGVNCLFPDTSNSTSLNDMTILGRGPQHAVAEGVVWGIGPYVYQPPE